MVEADLENLKMVAAISRHTNQKPTPDVTRTAKYQPSSGVEPSTINGDPSRRLGDSEGPSQMMRSVPETWSHIPVPTWPKSERAGQSRGTQMGRFRGGRIGEVCGASRYRED